MPPLKPPALDPDTVPARRSSTAYPEPLRAAVAGRLKQALGDAVGVRNFGVNLVRLLPGAASALRHWHERQDEFVYVLEGVLTLVTDAGEHRLTPGMAAGFPAGVADGHHLVNRSDRDAVYLEIGDRSPGDVYHYSDVDLHGWATPAGAHFTHKDGRPW